VVGLLLGLFLVRSALVAAQGLTVALQLQLNQSRAAMTQLQAHQAALEEQLDTIGQQIEQTRLRLGQLQSELDTFDRQHTSRSAGVASGIEALVPRVHILSIAQNEDFFVLSGRAGSQGLVLDYARALQANGGFVNVRILSMVNFDASGLVPDVQFAIELEQ
jgi:Tfp pilus assembly protein PilN